MESAQSSGTRQVSYERPLDRMVEADGGRDPAGIVENLSPGGDTLVLETTETAKECTPGRPRSSCPRAGAKVSGFGCHSVHHLVPQCRSIDPGPG